MCWLVQIGSYTGDWSVDLQLFFPAPILGQFNKRTLRTYSLNRAQLDPVWIALPALSHLQYVTFYTRFSAKHWTLGLLHFVTMCYKCNDENVRCFADRRILKVSFLNFACLDDLNHSKLQTDLCRWVLICVYSPSRITLIGQKENRDPNVFHVRARPCLLFQCQ